MQDQKLQRFNIKVVRREDGWYTITVPSLHPVSTQSATLNDVQELARHAIGQWLEMSPDLVVVTVVE